VLKRTIDSGIWYPVSIKRLDALLYKVIYSGRGHPKSYALRRNIAYNLQHIEFMDRCIVDLKMSNVLVTQTWKSLIVVGCGVVESLLHFLFIAKGIHAKTEWELRSVDKGNSKNEGGVIVKRNVQEFIKLDAPVLKHMTFDAMLKKARARKIFGANEDIYTSLDLLRPLRNRVHLQHITDVTDTDWNAFNWSEACKMAQVLLAIFTSNIFHPSAEQVSYFNYLQRYESQT